MWCHWCVIYSLRVNLQASVVYLWAPDLASFHNDSYTVASCEITACTGIEGRAWKFKQNQGGFF